MASKTIIKSLFKWFADSEILNSENELNVDYLDEEPENYCLEVVPCNPVVKVYVDGSAKCQYLFIFAGREHYSSDEVLNMANLEFYERIEDWIAAQNVNGTLPELPEGCTAQSVKVLSSGYVMDNDTKTARYQIQCRLFYIKTQEVN